MITFRFVVSLRGNVGNNWLHVGCEWSVGNLLFRRLACIRSRALIGYCTVVSIMLIQFRWLLRYVTEIGNVKESIVKFII